MRRTRVFVVAVSVVLLSGCVPSQGEARGDRPSINFVAGAAVLNEATETVQEPLDVYGPDIRGRQLLDRASDLLTEDCVHQAGHALTLVNVLDYPPSTQWSLKYFGPWTKDRASRTGLDSPYDALSEAHRVEDATIPPETYSVIKNCMAAETKSDEVKSLEQRQPEESIFERGRTATWSWASDDPIWQEARTQQGACLSAKGYALEEQRASISPKIAEAPNSEAGIRAALDQVDCLSSTGAAQTFVDVVAAYQVAFIAENEAALVADKKDTDERIAFAQKVISEHGGH